MYRYYASLAANSITARCSAAPKEADRSTHHSVRIGIRTEFDKDNGFTVLDACRVNDRGVDDDTQVKQIVGDVLTVYRAFDIDCLDPAFALWYRTPIAA